MRHGAGDERLALCLLAGVRGHREGGVAEGGRERLQRLRLTRREHDPGAVGHEGARDGLADAAARARDDGDLTQQVDGCAHGHKAVRPQRADGKPPGDGAPHEAQARSSQRRSTARGRKMACR